MLHGLAAVGAGILMFFSGGHPGMPPVGGPPGATTSPSMPMGGGMGQFGASGTSTTGMHWSPGMGNGSSSPMMHGRPLEPNASSTWMGSSSPHMMPHHPPMMGSTTASGTPPMGWNQNASSTPPQSGPGKILNFLRSWFANASTSVSVNGSASTSPGGFLSQFFNLFK